MVKLIPRPEVIRREFNFVWESPRFSKSATADCNTFTFLGQTESISSDWNDARLPKLWRYNLHYNDDLYSTDAPARPDLCAELVEKWITYNPPLAGDGWEPYCLSLRTVNWIKWLLDGSDKNISSVWLTSLYQQISVLEQKIEYHILGNHLFSNAKALVFGGVFFEGADASRWLKTGLELIDEQLNEQFLGDGGHFELSPMYHSILLWDLADLINLGRSAGVGCLRKRLPALERTFSDGMVWLETMVHPDGDVSFFNDSTVGVAPTLSDLRTYGAYLNFAIPKVKAQSTESVKHLSESGYCAIAWPDRSHCIIDVGKVGPDYQPGHAHADTLSCELSLMGRRIFVNSGISQYGMDEERNRQRSTIAHNTVVVDGQNSSEVWAGFRVARRAYPLDVSCNLEDEFVIISGAHTGYQRLKGRTIHRRSWIAAEGRLSIKDTVEGKYNSAIGRWYIHPEVGVTQVDDQNVLFSLASGQHAQVAITGARVNIIPSKWHPGFGVSVVNSCILFEFIDSTVDTTITWSSV